MIQKKSLKDAIQNPEIISVVGELIGPVSSDNNGLMTPTLYKFTNVFSASTERGKFIKLFNISQYGYGTFHLYSGDFVSNNPSTLYDAIITINNRSQSKLLVFIKAIKITSVILYIKYNTNNSIDVYVKIPDSAYTNCRLRWLSLSSNSSFTMVMAVEDSVSESELVKYEL